MKRSDFTQSNVLHFLNELKVQTGICGCKLREAKSIAVKHGLTPGYQIIDELLRLEYFRIDGGRLVCLKQYFPLANVDFFMKCYSKRRIKYKTFWEHGRRRKYLVGVYD